MASRNGRYPPRSTSVSDHDVLTRARLETMLPHNLEGNALRSMSPMRKGRNGSNRFIPTSFFGTRYSASARPMYAGGVAETGIGALRGRTFSATKVPAPTRDVRYPSDFSRSNVATTVPRDTRYCRARSRVDGRRVDAERRPSTMAARSSPYSQTDRG